MSAPWKTPVAWFTLFNLLAAPLIGRAVWYFMIQLNAGEARFAAVVLSLAATIGILAVNAWLTLSAMRGGIPRIGYQVMWVVTGLTFVLTVGFGSFSPINLLIAMFRAAAM
jgi:hypothetical protein